MPQNKSLPDVDIVRVKYWDIPTISSMGVIAINVAAVKICRYVQRWTCFMFLFQLRNQSGIASLSNCDHTCSEHCGLLFPAFSGVIMVG